MPEIYAQLVELKKAYDTKEEKPVSKVTLNNKNYFVVFEGPTKHLNPPDWKSITRLSIST